MEHEHSTYPDAVRFLAKKYNIGNRGGAANSEQAAIRDEKGKHAACDAFAQNTSLKIS